MNIGNRIKQRRLELALTVDDLADLIGKSRATIYRYENGDIENMPTTILEPLASALHTTPAYLMGWDNQTPTYMPGQLDLFEETRDSISDANMYETELINQLRALQKSSKEEYKSLCSVFARIPTLPKELREDIYEYAIISIRKYEKEQRRKNIELVSSTDNNDAIWEILGITPSFPSHTSSSELNAAHARTDTELPEDTDTSDDDIMDDDKNWK